MYLNTIMKWFIIVLMMSAYADGTQDMFWYAQPEFNTVQECQVFVTYNAGNIKMQMRGEFGPQPIETVYCVREDHLDDFGVPGQV